MEKSNGYGISASTNTILTQNIQKTVNIHQCENGFIIYTQIGYNNQKTYVTTTFTNILTIISDFLKD